MAVDTPSLDTIFCAAIEIASAEDRAVYVAGACGSDADLRGRVERLVGADFRAGSFLEPADSGPLTSGGRPSPASACCPPPMAAEGPGTIIGQYKLLEQIGEGGFGVVYMA